MKEGINKSIAIIGTTLLCVALINVYSDLLFFQKMEWAVRKNLTPVDLLNKIAIGTGLCLSLVPLFLSYYIKIEKKWLYTTQFLVSYTLAFFFLNSCLNFFKGIMYTFSFGVLNQNVGDLSNYELFSTALSQNPMYQHFLAWSMLATAFLICFRRSRPMGTILAIAISLNVFFLSTGFNHETSPRAVLLLSMSCYLLVVQWPFYSSIFLFNQKIKKRKYPFPTNLKLYESISIFKGIFLAGLLVFLHFKKESRWITRYYAEDNPIVGAWKIDHSETSLDRNQTKEFLQAEIFFFDKGSSAFIELNDSVSRFKYLLDPDQDQFDMYDFHQLREVDLKGKYELIDPDTLIFNGKNHRDSIMVKLIREKEYDRYIK